MKITLEKASGRSKCRGTDCSKNPEYISEDGRMVKGTTCAVIAIGGDASGSFASSVFYFYYCRECLDKVYVEVKSKLDSKLWVFS